MLAGSMMDLVENEEYLARTIYPHGQKPVSIEQVSPLLFFGANKKQSQLYLPPFSSIRPKKQQRQLVRLASFPIPPVQDR